MIEKELSSTRAHPPYIEYKAITPRFHQATKIAFTGIICATLGVASSVAVFQQKTHAQADTSILFTELDTNGDGVIQRQEYNSTIHKK